MAQGGIALGPEQVSPGQILLLLAGEKNRNLHRAHFLLTPSDAAFTSTHPERG